MKNPEDSETRLTPPYLPFRTFNNYITGLRSSGIPARIDKSVLKSMSGAVQSWLRNALQYFGLVDDGGTPTPTLREIVNTNDEERKERYAQLVHRYYDGLFKKVDTKKGTQAQLEEWFRTFEIATSTARRCAAFFLDMSKEAGLDLSPHFSRKETTYGRSSSGVRRRAVKNATKGQDVAGNMPEERRSGDDIPALQEKLIVGLVERLPAPGEEFPNDRRNLWLDMAKMTFRMVYGDVGD